METMKSNGLLLPTRGSENVKILQHKLKIFIMNLHLDAGADPGGGAIVPLKPSKVTLFIMIFYYSENNIGDVRPFCRPLFCHSSVLKPTSSLLQ